MVAAESLEEKRRLQLVYATELLRAGKAETAIRELETLKADIQITSPEHWPAQRCDIELAEAIANLRLGEDQNCCAVNTPDSCLLPIKGSGIHTRTTGSARAVSLLTGILRYAPDNLQARWLLNVAQMTLGKYPSGVPTKWLIEPSVFRSEYSVPRFPNVASLLGLNAYGHAGGLVLDDLDGDGNLDILATAMGLKDGLHFYHNNSDGTFVDRTSQANLAGLAGGINAIQADYDNDGSTDLFIMRTGFAGEPSQLPSSLLRNKGDGTFIDVTRQTGLHRAGSTRAATWLDYDNDGRLDLFVAYELINGEKRSCALFHNNLNGTFTDVAKQAGVDLAGDVVGAVSSDYDGDGYSDILITVRDGESGRIVLYHNGGNGKFNDVTAIAKLATPISPSGTFFFDYDNDGRPDLLVVGYRTGGVQDIAASYLGMPTSAERTRLYRNLGNGTFEDVSISAHVDKVMPGMGLNFGDLDNDGWLDFYVATGTPDISMIIPNRMFRNAGGKQFQEVTTGGDFGHLQKGHAVAFGDLNNDGCQDVFAQMGGMNDGDLAYSALFVNPGYRNHWLTLKLEGIHTNRSAIGARIKVTVTTPSGKRDMYRVVSSGGSCGANPLRQEIGLSDAQKIDRVEIFWPVTGRTQVLRRLDLDRFYIVREDQDKAVLPAMWRFQWPDIKQQHPLARNLYQGTSKSVPNAG
jgi:hypothetical protein